MAEEGAEAVEGARDDPAMKVTSYDFMSVKRYPIRDTRRFEIIMSLPISLIGGFHDSISSNATWEVFFDFASLLKLLWPLHTSLHA